ncbi:MAG TPA: hypothetical protein ENI05_11960 [Porticoccus sp.]|nr:hypothetical protein [Porticoccus sp.]
MLVCLRLDIEEYRRNERLILDYSTLSIQSTATAYVLSSDSLDSLEDGLHLAVFGAGSPMPSSNRSGSCLLVIAATLY